MRNLLLAALSLVFLVLTASYSQAWRVHPINVQYCNYYDAIFIGKILSQEEGEIFTTFYIEVEEEFKFQDTRCILPLKTKGFIPDYEKHREEEKWLIFAHFEKGEYYFDFDHSTGLNWYPTYRSAFIPQDLAYLRAFAMNPSQTIKEYYLQCLAGCVSDDDLYIAEGQLVNGYPHGPWIYYKTNGVVISEGSYMAGQKWGEWYDYFPDGRVGNNVTYDGKGDALKWIRYGGDGKINGVKLYGLYWEEEEISSVIPHLLPSEQESFCRDRIPITKCEKISIMPSYLKSLRALIGTRKVIHPGARIIIENDEGDILLIRRKDNDQWGHIAGGLEEDEDIQTCIIREVREETGLHIHSLEAIGLSTRPEAETVTYPNGDQVQYFTVIFYSNDWSGELLQATDETKEARFFPKAELPQLPPNEAPSLQWVGRYMTSGQFIID